MSARSRTGARAQIRGVGAEGLVCRALEQRGWRILLRRARTRRGEIDIVAEHPAEDLIAFIEVKARPTLGDAAWALTAPQRRRLLEAAQALIALHPHWLQRSLRFDLLLVDQAGRIRRIADAFRLEH